MYAKLQISGTATAAQIVTDLVAVLTGTTDVNALSAQIVKANSQIISTDPAGWTLVGDYLTTGKVLSAPVADNASQYKYVAIFTSGTSVAYQLGEGYNAGGKTLTTATASYGQISNHASNAVAFPHGYMTFDLYITASARHIGFHTLINSGGTYYAGDLGGVFECTRKDIWNTSSSGFLPAVQTNSTYGLIHHGSSHANNQFASGMGLNTTRYMADSGATPTIISAGKSAMTLPWYSGTPLDGDTNIVALTVCGMTTTGSSMVTNATGSKVHGLIPFGHGRCSHRFIGGEISPVCNIFITTTSFGAAYDTITVSGVTYEIWRMYATSQSLAIKRG
jgi:hypothetical protein